MRKHKNRIMAVGLTVLSLFGITSCIPPVGAPTTPSGNDVSIPELGKDGWYEVFRDDFNGTTLDASIWTYSPHAVRWTSSNAANQALWTSHWCPDMVTVKDGNVEIRAIQSTNHVCSQGICPSVGRFSGGFETRKIVSDPNENKGTADELLFSQAYGYFETRVKFPKAEGLWSAFWLQSSNQRKIGNAGKDGTEIDVFESAFIKNPKNMGHALIWDGYGTQSKSAVKRLDTGTDLYDGYHTYALKWTPTYYVFYIDGKPTWTTNAGDVSRVKEFLRFTVEMDEGNGDGPQAQKIGLFTDNSSVFYVDYIKVWQNSNYISHIQEDSVFVGTLDGAN